MTVSVRGGDETSSPRWLERESMLLLNSSKFLISVIVTGGGTPESHYRSEECVCVCV